MSRRILITGAASGIGKATAARLRAEGHRVAGLDLKADGDEIVACDVAEQASVDEAVAAAIGRLGGLDVLINNAGIGTPQRAGLAPGAGASAVIEINLLGPWRVTAAALPALRSSRGRVVNVASGLAHFSVPFAVAYCMSKRGLVAYSDALRLEHGHEITVTTVYPGYVRTPIHDASAEQGFSLEGMVPAEPVEGAAARIARAATGRPVRDLATTRGATLQYALLRRLPRRLVDRAILAVVRRRTRSGEYDGSPLAGELARALRGAG